MNPCALSALLLNWSRRRKSTSLISRFFCLQRKFNLYTPLEIWKCTHGAEIQKKNATRLHTFHVYIEIFAVANEITWQFHKRHIDLCLQTITLTGKHNRQILNAKLGYEIVRGSSWKSAHKHTHTHTKLINIAVVVGCVCVWVCRHSVLFTHIFSSPEVFVFVILFLFRRLHIRNTFIPNGTRQTQNVFFLSFL